MGGLAWCLLAAGALRHAAFEPLVRTVRRPTTRSPGSSWQNHQHDDRGGSRAEVAHSQAEMMVVRWAKEESREDEGGWTGEVSHLEDVVVVDEDEFEVPEDLKEQILEAMAAAALEEGEGLRLEEVVGLHNASASFPRGRRRHRDRARVERGKREARRSAAVARMAEFGLRPREVREHLDRFVVRQDAAKKVLSVAICDHYNVVRRCLGDPRERDADYSKPNILLLGPSGSGKTYIIRTLSRLLGVPFVKADATKFTEAGIVGEDAEDLVRELVQKADGDAELAQYGIVYVDEVDKLCGGGGLRGETAGGPQVASGGQHGNRGVQSSFLKIMEDTEVAVSKAWSAVPEIFFGAPGESGSRSRGPSRVSTKHILFIFSGAFTALDATLRRDREHRGLGFLSDAQASSSSSSSSSKTARSGWSHSRPSLALSHPPDGAESGTVRSYLGEATSADLVSAGLEPEFVGRIPVRVAVEPLSASDLEEILLTSEGSVLRQYERDFAGYGIELVVKDDFVRAVAVAAEKEATGARGLVTVLERTFRDFKYTLPCAGVDAVVCTEATVRDPDLDLARLLETKADPAAEDRVRAGDAARFAADLASAAGLKDVSFDDDAVRHLVKQSRAANLAVTTLCKRHLGWDVLDTRPLKTLDQDDDDDDDGSGLACRNPVLDGIVRLAQATDRQPVVLPLGLVLDSQARSRVLDDWRRIADQANTARRQAKDRDADNDASLDTSDDDGSAPIPRAREDNNAVEPAADQSH